MARRSSNNNNSNNNNNNNNSSNNNNFLHHLTESFVRDVWAPIVRRPRFPDADEWDGAVFELTKRLGTAARTTTLIPADRDDPHDKLERVAREVLVNAYSNGKREAAPVMEVEVPCGVLVRNGDYGGAVRAVTAFLDDALPREHQHCALFSTKQRRGMALGRLHCLRATALVRVGAYDAALEDCSAGKAALANVTVTGPIEVDALLVDAHMTILRLAALQSLGGDVSASAAEVSDILNRAVRALADDVEAREAVERQQRTFHDLQRAWGVCCSPVFRRPTDVSYIALRRTCPGSVRLLVRHLDLLSREGMYDRAANECERWACEAVALDDAFHGSIQSKNPYPTARPAAFLRRHTFEGQSRTRTDTALNPFEVGEAVLRMPTEALQFYLLALWMENRIQETKAAVGALRSRGTTIKLADGTDLLQLPSDALPIYLLSLGSADSCFAQVKNVILSIQNRRYNKDGPVPEGLQDVREGAFRGSSAVKPDERWKPTARFSKDKSHETSKKAPSIDGIRQGVIRGRDGTVLRRTVPVMAGSSEG
jgi:hypothetical protein